MTMPPMLQGVSNSADTATTDDASIGLLAAVIVELETERARRAQLEEEVELLRDELEDMRLSRAQQDISTQEFEAMQAERDGYQQLVEALTADNRAISAAIESSTIPTHLIRMLEVIPWDEKLQKHALVEEEVYEWQTFKNGKWGSTLRQFPETFRHLPVIKPTPGFVVREETVAKNGLFGELLTANNQILTNETVTRLIRLENGYPLPSDGGVWEWVGTWKVEKRAVKTSKPSLYKKTVDCDVEGWSYGEEPVHFREDPTQLCYADLGMDEVSGAVARPYRRRKWTRTRALVSYPYASERTSRYLKLQAENARLSVMSEKMNDQLVSTKALLTAKEEASHDAMVAFHRETARLQSDVAAREGELMRALSAGFGSESPGGGSPRASKIQNKSPQKEKEPEKEMDPWDKVKSLVESIVPQKKPSERQLVVEDVSPSSVSSPIDDASSSSSVSEASLESSDVSNASEASTTSSGKPKMSVTTALLERIRLSRALDAKGGHKTGTAPVQNATTTVGQ